MPGCLSLVAASLRNTALSAASEPVGEYFPLSSSMIVPGPKRCKSSSLEAELDTIDGTNLIEYLDMPIEIVSHNTDLDWNGMITTTVSFKIVQRWKSNNRNSVNGDTNDDGSSSKKNYNEVTWIGTEYYLDNSRSTGDLTCRTAEHLLPESTTKTYTAKCEENKDGKLVTRVRVYVHDRTFDDEASVYVPYPCDPPTYNFKQMVGYTFTIPCECDDIFDSFDISEEDSAEDKAETHLS